MGQEMTLPSDGEIDAAPESAKKGSVRETQGNTGRNHFTQFPFKKKQWKIKL